MAKKNDSDKKANPAAGGKKAAKKALAKPLSPALEEVLAKPEPPAPEPFKEAASGLDMDKKVAATDKALAGSSKKKAKLEQPAKIAKAGKKEAKGSKLPATVVEETAVLTYTTEDIALRAYFIAENRHRNGIHGNEHLDWVEAERQLQEEQERAAKKKGIRQKKPVK